MILYHYSVNSYRGDASLKNDYNNQYEFAEPYLLALEKGRSVFDAVFYATMYMGREVRALKLRKYENYDKSAVEGIFEYVRKTEFPAKVSRLRCVYYCESIEEAVRYIKEDCLDCGLFTKDQVKLLEVEVEEGSLNRYDQSYYNRAIDAIRENRADDVFALARAYYAEQRSEDPLVEIVSSGKNRIIRLIDY